MKLRYGIVVVLAGVAVAGLTQVQASGPHSRDGRVVFAPAAKLATTTPIKHLVVLFQENISFDHYFGTYPHAANLSGETKWVAAKGTPSVTGLTSALLHHNPNLYNPVRLNAKEALTCDQDHGYTAEQKAEDAGKMDKFVQYTTGSAGDKYQYCPKDIALGYFDGNTVTALWNYAQHFVLGDNMWGSQFGPSTPGALNLATGDTGTVLCGPAADVINAPVCTSTPPSTSGPTGTVFSDADPYYDKCSDNGKPNPAKDIAMSGPNIGSMLSTAGVSWGWFQGGFGTCMEAAPPKHGPVLALERQGATLADDTTDQTIDYSPHHDPFQYYAQTANPMHLAPQSASTVGSSGQAEHQYDLSWFWKAADAGHLPAVSFLKAPRYEDGHAATSDPLDEQNYLVQTINAIEKLPAWKSTAIVIAWDDSDGWYDNKYAGIENGSNSSLDYHCGTTPAGTQPGRCGFGPRLPILIISPFAKSNYVFSSRIDQTSIIRFVEDNWLKGERVSAESFDNHAGSLLGAFNFKASNKPLFLNPLTGRVTSPPK